MIILFVAILFLVLSVLASVLVNMLFHGSREYVEGTDGQLFWFRSYTPGVLIHVCCRKTWFGLGDSRVGSVVKVHGKWGTVVETPWWKAWDTLGHFDSEKEAKAAVVAEVQARRRKGR